MKKIILTGFKPFGDYLYNPTEQSTLDFHGKIIGDREVIGIVLPCIYKAWGHLISPILHNSDAYAVISTGLDSNAKGIRIESTFHNNMNGKYPDATGYSPKNIPIMQEVGAPAFVKSKAPNKKLFEALQKAGIPTERSRDAGGFICNALGFMTSLAVRRNGYLTRNMFVHIPWTTAYQDRVSIAKGKMYLDHELYYKGLELLIKTI